MSTVMSAGIATDRKFYTGMAFVSAAVVLIGFSPTFFMRPGTLPPLELLLITHGVVFSTWIALVITQTSLIAANRRDIHRKLGVAGVLVAAALVSLGTLAAIHSMRLGHAPVKDLDPRSFFAIPMRDMVIFPILVGCAVAFRRDLETHKRLMILATFSILDAAFARWPLLGDYGPPAFFGMVDLLIAAACFYDWRTRGKVHKAYKWGAALIVLTQPLVLVISGTAPWLAFASWVRG